jgi:ABC-2 type transport system permease protein
VITPAWLIAEREFRTYASTWSFWLALLLGPLMMAGVSVLARPSGPTAVVVRVDSPDLAGPARAALAEAAAVEGSRISIGPGRGPALVVRHGAADQLRLSFSPRFPLSHAGQVLVARTLERDMARARLAQGVSRPSAQVSLAPTPSADVGGMSRFAIVLMLWLSLTGSLGMLLQAVVRERANRALETLLAAARPWEIVAGKVLGVGLVSLLVLGTWLGSAAVAAAFTPAGAGAMAAIVRSAGDPLSLARALAIYLLAFAFYGLATVALGAMARDSASAQNLSRPMFLILLAAFFVAMASAGASGPALAWLAYVPPFTPFVLLMQPGSLAGDLPGIGVLAIATGVAGWLAVFLVERAFGLSAGPILSLDFFRKRR